MITYNHTLDIPQSALNTLIEALMHFSQLKNARLDAWYHDLPVWMLRRTQGDVTTSVQVDAMAEIRLADRAAEADPQVVACRKMFYFTPIAYRAAEATPFGAQLQVRHVPTTDAIHGGRIVLTIDGGPQQPASEGRILEILTTVWSAAERLPLDDTIVLSATDARTPA